MSCDIRAALVPCVDAARRCVEDLGLRTEVVEIITVEWAGLSTIPGLPQDGYLVGAGTPSEIERITIDPRPVVSDPHPRLVAQDPGKYASGDRIITKVSRAYTPDDFPDAPDGPGGEKRERYFLIDGDPYRMVREPTIKNFEWEIQVRRMRPRPPIP